MAPLTLNDIMDFMMRDKEERAQEREKDKEEIRNMISDGVKIEVEKTVKPFQEKQALVEKAQDDLMQQFKEMVEEVKVIKNQVHTSGSNQDFPPLPQPNSQVSMCVAQPRNSLSVQKNIAQPHETFYQDPEVAEIISLGLHRIDRDDLERI